jgi:octaprenyl-diphosphate synthase
MAILICQKNLSVAVREMSEGITPNRKARRLDITEDIYYEIIRKKAAHLSLLVVR